MSEDHTAHTSHARELDDYVALDHLDKPHCPHCDRELGTAPGMGGIAFKCVQHGKFHTSEFEANPLDVMSRRMEGTSSTDAILTALPVVFLAAGINAVHRLGQRIRGVVP